MYIFWATWRQFSAKKIHKAQVIRNYQKATCPSHLLLAAAHFLIFIRVLQLRALNTCLQCCCHSTIITDCNKLSKLALNFQACCNTSMMHMLVNITANGVLSETSHRLSKAYCTSQCHTVLWYTCKCNFIYAHERKMTFPAPIFSKLGIAYMTFSISPKSDGSNVGSKNIPSFMPVSKDWL